MGSNERATKQKMVGQRLMALKWSGLQSRMTISYALTTLAAVIIAEVLLGSALWAVLIYSPLVDNDFVGRAGQVAEQYALAAAVLANDNTLNPQTTFQPGQPTSLVQPYLDPSASQQTDGVQYTTTLLPESAGTSFALLVTPDGHVLASSYPARYAEGGQVSQVLPAEVSLIEHALAGVPRSAVAVSWRGRVISFVEPVPSREKKVIGAIYFQEPELGGPGVFQGLTLALLLSGLFWLVVTLLVGMLFGLITTRGLVRRLQRLVTATTRFADGDYSQRVQVSRRDEVGLLEEQFNRMAEQLVESITLRQAFAEQNARMAERARISRDLHDSVKQQAFAVSMQTGAALALWDHNREAARTHLSEAETLAYHVQQELTTLIQELRPLALQDKGLAAALQEYVTMWSRQRAIGVDLHLSETCTLSSVIEEALWRVTQEALSNIARHSHATQVQIALACEQGQVTLTVEDNGQGFEPSATNGSGVGLHSMQERMQSLGGALTIHSSPGGGTRIVAHCPYMNNQPEAAEELRIDSREAAGR